MRDVQSPKFSLVLIAAVLVLPALAQAQDTSSQNQAPSVFSYGIGRAQHPPMMMTVIGFTNANVANQTMGFPCMGGTAGCADQTPGTIALSVPMAVVLKGSKITYTFELESVSYTGPCSLGFTVTDGTAKLDSGHYTFPAGCKPNTVYFASFNRILKSPLKMGVGSIKGFLKAGKHTDKIVQNFCYM
jgi:hypothetical protein